MEQNIQPQEGPQTQFFTTEADIAIYGGAAGGGKTWSLLYEPMRHIQVPGFGAVIFRRTTKQIHNKGGLWDEAQSLYPLAQAYGVEYKSKFIFPYGSDVQFAHMEYEKNRFDWQGSQIPMIGFDELTHFTEKQFWYMLSRNRSLCGIRPYVRATCNPDASSWVRKFIDWWIGEDGYAIEERSGKIRWFIRVNEKLVWADTSEELNEKYPDIPAKSLTFISATLEDNQILMEKDPGYKANLMALDRVERERLMGGNWNIMPSAGLYFKKHYFPLVSAAPKLVRVVRCWDRAATEWKEGDPGDPDWTVGLKLGVDRWGVYYLLDIIRERLSPLKVDKLIKSTAQHDGVECIVKTFQDPGAAGKNEAQHFVRMMAGYPLHVDKIQVDKITAAKPSSSQAEANNICILDTMRQEILDDFFTEVQNFPEWPHDDQVDALSGALNYLALEAPGEFSKDMTGEIDNDIFENEEEGEDDGGLPW